MSLTDLLVPTYRQMLRALDGLLEKARQQITEQAEALLSARLAADMYPLASQIRFAAFQSYEAVFRLLMPFCEIKVSRSGRRTTYLTCSLMSVRDRCQGLDRATGSRRRLLTRFGGNNDMTQTTDKPAGLAKDAPTALPTREGGS